MVNKFIRFLCVAGLLFIVSPVLSQSTVLNGYAVQHFTDENGLPQNSVNALLFDNDGYLWLATEVGLVRFNGSSFRLFYPEDKPVMESNIQTLGLTEGGQIFFETIDRRLYCHNAENSQFLCPMKTPAAGRTLLLNRRTQAIDFHSFLSRAGSSAELEQRRRIFQRLLAVPANFFAVDSGNVYIVQGDSVFYYGHDSLRLIAASGVRGAQCVVMDRSLYVLHRDTVAAVYKNGRHIAGPSMIGGDWRPAAAYQFYAGAGPWHLLVGNRLYRLVPESEGRIRSEFLTELGLSQNISAIEYNERIDLLVIATNTDGFYLLRRNHFGAAAWPGPLRERLERHRFGPLTLLGARDILTDRFIFTPDGRYSPARDSGAVWQRCLYIDKKGAVWAGRDRFPRQLDSAMRLRAEMPALDANIVDYAEGSDGRLYCLTERSLWVREPAGFRRLYTPAWKNAQDQNESMTLVGGGRLWVATTAGLFEYDPEKGAGLVFPELSGEHVRALHTCRDGSVLVGTYGNGVYYYYHGRFHSLPLDRNQFLITAHCFLEDSRGMVWISCNKGLFKIPKADLDAWCTTGIGQLYYYYYGRQDGLLTNEFNGGFNDCGVITPDGFVAILSMKGIVCFYTDSLETHFPTGSIVMAHVDIDGRSAPRTDTINTGTGYNSLTVEISSPYMGNRNNLYLQYCVSGLSEEWKEVPEDGMINLSRLAAGTYNLRLRKVNAFGGNNFQFRQWSIIVPPVFYQTGWFRVLSALTLLVLLVYLVRLRLKLIEKKEKLRLSEQALRRSNLQKEKLISLVIHDLRSPLRFLTLLASDLHDNQEKFSSPELKDRSYWVKKGAQDIYHFSEDFLLWVSSQKNNFKISKQLFAVRPLLQEIYDFYCGQARQKGNRLSYAADETLKAWSDPHLVIIILRNLTDNANKYTQRGDIRIEARQEDGQLLILVADSGRGMSPQEMAAFLGEGDPGDLLGGSQLGHQFVVDLTRRLNGWLTVDTGERRGTTVTLHIPMERPAGSGDGDS